MNYEVNLVNDEINNHSPSSCNLKLWERNQSAHEILLASERSSISIAENISSTSYSPREEKSHFKVDYKKNMLYIGYQNWIGLPSPE